MSNEIKLNCYTIQLRDRSTRAKKGNFHKLKEVPFSTDDGVEIAAFSDFFRKFIENFDGKFQGLKGNNNAVYLPPDNRLTFDSGRQIIYGFMKAGRTGTGRQIFDMEDPEGLVFEVKPKHVDSTDYFFLIWAPEDSNTGLMIVQGYSDSSASEVFKRLLNKFFSDNAHGQVVEFSRYVPKETIKLIKERGKIDQIKLTKKRVAPDRINNMLGVNFINTHVSIEIKITGLENYTQHFKNLMDSNYENIKDDLMMGGARFFTTPVLDNLGMDGPYDFAVHYDFNGKSAIARQSKKFNIAPNIYIPEGDIERDETTNLPTKESLEAYCLDFFEMLKGKILPTKPDGPYPV